MDAMELEQLSTAAGMRDVVKKHWVDAQPAVEPYLECHRVAVRTLSVALADVDPNPKAYLDQVLKARIAEQRASLALLEIRREVGLEFDKACPLGCGFDRAAR